MNCREAEHCIFADRDGALDQSRRAALSAHIAECAACRRVRDDLTAAFQSLATTTQTARVPDADLEWQKLRHEIRGASTAPRRSLATWIGVPLAAAAAVALGLYIAPGVHRPTQIGSPAESVVRQDIANVTASSNTVASTVVYTDDNSGWTFVWAPDTAESDQHI